MASFRRPAAAALAAFALGIGVGFRWGQSASATAEIAALPDLAMFQKPDGSYAALQPERLPLTPVLSVVDGDTIRVLFNDRDTIVRYYGINTPEKDQPCYAEATERNRALVGGAVRLGFDERREDKYNRLLAYIFTPEGVSVDATLAAEGVARAWRRDGRFREQIVPLELKARGEKIGCLWSGAASAPKKPSHRRKKASV